MWPTFYMPTLINIVADVTLVDWVCSPQTMFYLESTGIMSSASVPIPTSVRSGDLIIVDMNCYANNTPDAATVLPAGYSRIMETRQAGPIGYKIADGTEGGTNLTFSFYANTNATLYKFCVLIVRNANTEDPFGCFATVGGDNTSSRALHTPLISSSNARSLHLYLTQARWNSSNDGLDGCTPMDQARLVGGQPYANRLVPGGASPNQENSYFVYKPATGFEVANLFSNHTTITGSWGGLGAWSRKGYYTTVDLTAGEDYVFAASNRIPINATQNFTQDWYLSVISPSSGEATTWFDSSTGAGKPAYCGSRSESGNMSGAIRGAYSGLGGQQPGTDSSVHIGGIAFTAPESGTYTFQIGRCNGDAVYTYYSTATVNPKWACLAPMEAPIFPITESWNVDGSAFSGRAGTRGRGWWMDDVPGAGGLNFTNGQRGWAFEIVPRGNTRPPTYLDVQYNFYAHHIESDDASGVDAATSSILYSGAGGNYQGRYYASQLRGQVMQRRKFYCEFQVSQGGATTNLRISVAGGRSVSFNGALSAGGGSPFHLEGNTVNCRADNRIGEGTSDTQFQAASGSAWLTTDYIGVGLDTDSEEITFYKNGTAIGTWPMLFADDLFGIQIYGANFSSVIDVNANFTGPFGGRKPTGHVAWDWEHEVA